jgi:predicted AAA+ superfamily ATPase
MYSRIINKPIDKSFFLFGPRGTGKTTWVHTTFPQGLMIDLLDSGLYYSLLASPRRLENLIPPGFSDWIIIDEIQRIPDLLNEVHRLIENLNCKFVLTGSSARKLRKKGVNLLAGRAVTRYMHPLTAYELGDDYSLGHSLSVGQLPSAYMERDPADYLESYIHTYLREEILQEGLTRNLQAFARFLEAASFSQASLLNISAVARECGVNRKLAEGYFHILDDLLLSRKLPVFAKRARRRMAAHLKFFFFDAGVYRTLRPKGPLDRPEEIDGSALETLVFQEICAVNDNWGLGYDLYYWRTASNLEVDFILYGEKGFYAIEVKRARTIRQRELSGLKAFLKDYPMAKGYLFYGGDRRMYQDGIELIPVSDGIRTLPMLLNNQDRQ